MAKERRHLCFVSHRILCKAPPLFMSATRELERSGHANIHSSSCIMPWLVTAAQAATLPHPGKFSMAVMKGLFGLTCRHGRHFFSLSVLIFRSKPQGTKNVCMHVWCALGTAPAFPFHLQNNKSFLHRWHANKRLLSTGDFFDTSRN